MSCTVSCLPSFCTCGSASNADRSANGIRSLSFAMPSSFTLPSATYVGVGEDVLGEQLAALDLDVEALLQAEDDVEEVDALRVEIALQGRLGRDLVLLDAEGVDERFLDLLEDLFFGGHSRVYSLAVSV